MIITANIPKMYIQFVLMNLAVFIIKSVNAGIFSKASNIVSNLGRTIKIIPINSINVIPTIITGYMIAPLSFLFVSHSF